MYFKYLLFNKKSTDYQIYFCCDISSINASISFEFLNNAAYGVVRREHCTFANNLDPNMEPEKHKRANITLTFGEPSLTLSMNQNSNNIIFCDSEVRGRAHKALSLYMIHLCILRDCMRFAVSCNGLSMP